MKQNLKKLKTFIYISSILFCLSSCGMRAEQKSLTSKFAIADVLISQNQFKEAKKELKQIQKSAFDYWSYLGVYRRYVKLGETELAENTLKNAIKKNPENPELSAVYAKFLLKDNRINDAVAVSKKLKGGKYGSIYSEAILKQASELQEKENLYSFFNKDEFYDIYFDAYAGTRNPIWLRNCAVFNLTSGKFGSAGRLNPSFYADADDAYFWALVLYDAGKFYEALTAIQKSKQFLSDFENKNLFNTSLILQVALESDSYMAISAMEKAEKSRNQVIENFENLKVRKSDEALLPIIFTNSAIYLKNQGKINECADLLFFIVNSYPLYVPALIQYADFAWESNQEREEDMEIKALRKAGIKTIEMEKYDSRRKIPLSDAVYRIDEALKQEKNPYLEIKRLDLKYKTQNNLTEKEKERNLWNLLEDNYDENAAYETLLIQYSLNFLIANKRFDDAWNLYEKYLMDHIKFDEKLGFWENFIVQMRSLELSIVEIGAWFAANNKLESEAVRIYEYCVYESNGIKEDNLISPYVSTGACMNLADIYYSLGQKEKAVSLYASAVGRESKNSLRSEIYYRIACVYYSMGDNKSALRSAEYARDIFPENAKAGLLKDKILLK